MVGRRGGLAALAALGTWDLLQTRHTILRAYPILGHARFLAELMRPEIQQYFVESNTEGAPFDRETRDMVYERAKGMKGDEPFGTERNVYAVGYEFLRHSLRARAATEVSPTGAAGRTGLRPALRHRAAQRLGHELRCAVGQCDRGPQRRRRHRRFRP